MPHLYSSVLNPVLLGGMTVALSDVVILTRLLLACENFHDQDQMSDLLDKWHWSRKPLASTVNILSVALYDLFGADGKPFVCICIPLYSISS